MTDIEATFRSLAAQFVEKNSELKALAAEHNAAHQRLAELLKREAEAQLSFKKSMAAMQDATKRLEEARRNAVKTINDAEVKADQIIAKGRDRAAEIVEDVSNQLAAIAERYGLARKLAS
jgi:hypothetical protein